MATTTTIPFFGLERQYRTLREEILATSDQVYKSGRVLDGEHTREFERQIAKRCHRRYAVAVNSGTQALVFAQRLLYPENAKVLIPCMSFVATINSVLASNHTPVLCDVDDEGLINLDSLDHTLNDIGVAGITYVNLFGNVVDWNRFKLATQFFNSNIKIIEDAAQSFGAKYQGQPSGSLGDLSILSFDPTKNLPNYGSGGMILCDDLMQYTTLINYRDNGKRTNHEIVGTNSKMSENDCAQMLVKLSYFDQWQRRRSEIAEYYSRELAPFVYVPQIADYCEHAWHKFVIRSRYRDELRNFLGYKEIETRIHYDKPLYEYDVGVNYINLLPELYRKANDFALTCLSLPIYPELTDPEVEYVVDSFREFFNRQWRH